MTQRLITQHAGGAGSEPDSAPAVQAALLAATAHLTYWLGPDGCSALLTRALKKAAHEHRVLEPVTVVTESAPALVGIDESLVASDARVVAAALHATLVELFDLLTRMVGADLTTKLAEQMMVGDGGETVRGDGEEAGS